MMSSSGALLRASETVVGKSALAGLGNLWSSRSGTSVARCAAAALQRSAFSKVACVRVGQVVGTPPKKTSEVSAMGPAMTKAATASTLRDGDDTSRSNDRARWGGDSGDRQPVRVSADTPSVYFACLGDFCDHIFLYPSGTYALGASSSWGRWKLSQPPIRHLVGTVENGACAEGGGLLLELFEGGSSAAMPASALNSHAEARGIRRLVANGVSTACFATGPSQMLHVDGPLLPPPAGSGNSGASRGLVFSSVGSQCLSVVRDTWLANPGIAEFDIALVFYKDTESEIYLELKRLAEEHADIVEVVTQPGMKWPNFRHWVEEGRLGSFTSLATSYDCVWVVDDDVRLSTLGINKLFSLMREQPELQIASPSFAEGSDGVWRFFDGHDPRYKLRYTDFVECTAPVIRSSMFLDATFVRALRTARTGCFLDFAFHSLAGGARDSVGILDAVQCLHPPRGDDVPSEMRALKPWEDHKDDSKYFEESGLPKEWWWYRHPKVFSAVPTIRKNEDHERGTVADGKSESTAVGGHDSSKAVIATSGGGVRVVADGDEDLKRDADAARAMQSKSEGIGKGTASGFPVAGGSRKHSTASFAASSQEPPSSVGTAALAAAVASTQTLSSELAGSHEDAGFGYPGQVRDVKTAVVAETAIIAPRESSRQSTDSGTRQCSRHISPYIGGRGKPLEGHELNALLYGSTAPAR
eukprot:TRINITY_DN38245_c0_g1_i1.p1 TRINITY_DN38245_c0_g1~~TRINITY_DN38245_c0_g1_i1.p1  ORF type:complete len:699 (+),score=114.17 TRINITY_DN38245_c0_g1_i1:163-2259(+)